MVKNQVEILSPCGSMESFYAAIAGGSDAVYLAGKMFGARSFANNFTNEELIEVINYAHLYGVKVYVTCNILIYEKEVPNFLKYVEFLHKNHVDALIMQDIGMVDLVHQTFPNLELHASTQMHIHNLEGALFAKQLGIKRIVIARETPIEVIKEIKEKTNLEIEVFVHGALCASYSGMCLFASSLGPRSGNRGTCSGCCRLPYDVLGENSKVLNKDKYPLSMKDLNTLEYLDKLIDLGVTSLKIEGRMKSPSYVYTVTKLYKETRDNYLKYSKIIINQEDLYNLKNIFHRTYTKGFIFNEENNLVVNPKFPNHQGVLIGTVIKTNPKYIDIKLNDNVNIHDGLRIINDNFEYGLILNEFYLKKEQVYEGAPNDIIRVKVNKSIPLKSKVFKTSSFKITTEIKKIIESKPRKIPIKISAIIKKGEPITLIASDFKNEVSIKGNLPALAKTMEIKTLDIKEKLLKVQNTIYQVTDIDINLDKNLFVPISHINNLKRTLIELLTKKRLANMEKSFKVCKYHREVLDFKKKKGYTLLTSNNNNFNNLKYDYIYQEYPLTNKDFICKLPKVMSSYKDIKKENEYLVSELGGVYQLKNIITDYSLNVTNSYSVALLHSLGVKRITLSLELSDSNIKDLIIEYKKRYQKNPNLELIVKTYIKVMVLKFKFSEYYKNPKYLVDRFKNKYKIIEKNGLTYIYDYKETVRENHDFYFQIGINYLREEEING